MHEFEVPVMIRASKMEGVPGCSTSTHVDARSLQGSVDARSAIMMLLGASSALAKAASNVAVHGGISALELKKEFLNAYQDGFLVEGTLLDIGDSDGGHV